MSLHALARRRWLVTRAAGVLAAAALGAAVMAGLAWTDGRGAVTAAAVGAVAAAATAARLCPWKREPALEVDPDSDPDGLVRAALVIPSGHPAAPFLSAEAAGRRWRFQRTGILGPLAVLAAASLLLALWTRSAPIAAQLAAEAPGSRAGAGAGAAPGAADAPASGERVPPSTDQPRSRQQAAAPVANELAPATEGARGEPDGPGAWSRVQIVAAPGARFRTGRDFGPVQAAVERYLRLRAEVNR